MSLGPLGLNMARRVTAGHEALRASERRPDTSGKFDVGYHDASGKWVHICRYSDKDEAQDAAERLSDPSAEEQELIGLPESPDTKVIAR